MTALFEAMVEPADGELAVLGERLRERAAADGLLDLVYRTLDTAIGTLLVAATPVGIVSVTFDGVQPDATLERLAGSVGPRILRAGRSLDDAAAELEQLIAGERERYLGAVDLRLAHGFRAQVVRQLRDIPFGETRSYGEIANAIGSPKAVRAVGTACAKNPLPIVFPCHRVVRADGSPGRYAGGDEAKALLLSVEAEHRLP